MDNLQKKIPPTSQKILASKYAEYARKPPYFPKYRTYLKTIFVKNIHFSMGNDNLERNPKSEPKKFSRLCTFNPICSQQL